MLATKRKTQHHTDCYEGS